MGCNSELPDRQQRILIGALGLAANALIANGDVQSALVALGLSAIVQDIATELGYDATSESFMVLVQNEAHEFAKKSLAK